MSESDYDQLSATGKLPPTAETFTSPTQAFSEAYEGAVVKFRALRRNSTTRPNGQLFKEGFYG
jgi:hypothetical protein